MCTKATDVWSVGCIFAEILSGEVLFSAKLYELTTRLGEPELTNMPLDSRRLEPIHRFLGYPVSFTGRFPVVGARAIDLLQNYCYSLREKESPSMRHRSIHTCKVSSLVSFYIEARNWEIYPSGPFGFG